MYKREVLVEGKLYKKNEVVKTIRTDIEGVASTSADLLPYGKFRIVESEAPNGYLTDGAKPIDFTITENGKIVDLTDKAHSIYNQIKRGDIEGVKIGAGTHQRLADVPFRITSKTTGENHVVVTDDNGQFSTSADWASHKHNTNAGKTSITFLFDSVFIWCISVPIAFVLSRYTGIHVLVIYACVQLADLIKCVILSLIHI